MGVRAIAVVPLFKDGQLAALHVCAPPRGLEFEVPRGDREVNAASWSYSRFYTLDENGQNFIPATKNPIAIEATTKGAAIIDLPRTHQVFVVLDDPEVHSGGRQTFENDASKPHWRNITHDITQRLIDLGFLGDDGTPKVKTVLAIRSDISLG